MTCYNNAPLKSLLNNLPHTQIWLLKHTDAPYSVIAFKQIQMDLIMDDIRAMSEHRRLAPNVISFPARFRVPNDQPTPPRAA